MAVFGLELAITAGAVTSVSDYSGANLKTEPDKIMAG